MVDFQAEQFLRLLQDAPPKLSFLEPAEYSKYLEEKVFDPLRGTGTVHLRDLDWSAFGLGHTTPERYLEQYDRRAGGWAETLNHRLQSITAVPSGGRRFF